VEDIDEKAITEFIQARTCRRRVLSQHFDGESDRVDCRSTDSVFCDRCKATNHPRACMKLGEPNGGCPAEAKVEEDAEQDIWQEAQPRVGHTQPRVGHTQPRVGHTQPRVGHTQPRRPQIIAQRLRESQKTQEIIIKAMNQLQGECIYCALMFKGEGGAFGSDSRAQANTPIV